MSNADKSFNAFTTRYERLANRLNSEARICYNGKCMTVHALWDTGATCSCISNEVVNALTLVPTGRNYISTPSGSKEVGTYLIDIILPNNVGVKDVRVCDSDIGAQGLGLLIGMDIIGLGDFSVSNFRGKTVFTFRYPSKQITDYVLESKIGDHGKGKRKH